MKAALDWAGKTALGSYEGDGEMQHALVLVTWQSGIFSSSRRSFIRRNII